MKSRSDRMHLAPADVHALTDSAERQRDDLQGDSGDAKAAMPHVKSRKPRLTSIASDLTETEASLPSGSARVRPSAADSINR
jgi:hypothetical protein